MTSQWDDWLRELAAQKMGGRDWILPAITPGFAWKHVFAIDTDVSAHSFTADVQINPNAPTALVAMSVTVGGYSGGVTPVTLDLTAAQVATITASAGDNDYDGISEAIVNLYHTPPSSDQYRAAATNIEILE